MQLQEQMLIGCMPAETSECNAMTLQLMKAAYNVLAQYYHVLA